MFARDVVIDVGASRDEVEARIRGRLRGDIGWGTELMLPVTRVGSGPPDFIGRLDGHRFRLHTTWRPNLTLGQRSLLQVAGTVEACATGARVSASIRPRPIMFWILAAAAVALVVGLVVSTTNEEFLTAFLVFGASLQCTGGGW